MGKTTPEINLQSGEERTAFKNVTTTIQKFLAVEQVLYGVEDLYERQHVGTLARNVFSSILSGCKLFQVIKNHSVESVELITHN